MKTNDFIKKKDFEIQYPHCYKEYLKGNMNTYNSFNRALDNLLISFGIGVVLIQVFSKSDKLLGFKSYIKFYPHNSLNFESGQTLYIEDYTKFKVAQKAEKVTTIKALDILENKLSRMTT